MGDKTITIRRKNVFLDVAPELVDKYKAKGYDVVDKFGNVIEKSIPNDPNSLKHAYDQQVAEIAQLKDRIRELETQLKAKSQAPVKVEAKPVEAKTEDVVEAKPKTSGKKSKKSV